MPTDENNGVNPQNQQVNPNQQVDSNLVGNQAVKDSGDPDDFDFSFDDSNGSGKGGDIQAQMKREGRSGMFLSPDENMRKKEEEEPAENVVIPTKKRSGMFLTPDEESEKEIAENDGETFSFHDQNDPNSVDSSEKEDAYLAEIDPSDVEDDPTDKFNALGSDSSQDEDHDGKLDEEIEDLVSFGNTDNFSNNNGNSAVPEQPAAAPAEPEATVPEQPVAASAEPEVTVPEQPAAAPAEPEATVPEEPVAASAEPEVTVPEQPAAAPAEPEATVPEQPVVAPAEPETTVPEEPVAASAEPEVTVPEQPAAAPAEPEATVPEQPVVAPAEPETTVPEEPVTVPEQPVAAPEQPVVSEEPVTVPEEPVTVPEQPVVSEEPVTVPEEPVTVPEQPVVSEEPVTVPEEPVVSEQPVTAPEEPVTAPVAGNQGEENWLEEEDQKVNDTFGTSENSEDIAISKNIDISPENVAENVENVIVGEPTNDSVGNNVVEQNNLVVENNLTNVGNDLHIENLGTDVVENRDGDLVSDLGGGNISNEQYVPNEAEFSQMSNLLNSSSTGPIDLNNINDQGQDILNQMPVEAEINNGGLNIQTNDIVTNVPTSIPNNNAENQINFEMNVEPVASGLQINQVEPNNVVDQPQGTIDLDKIQGGISLDSMIDNDIQDMHVQPQQNNESASQQNQSTDVNQNNIQAQQPVTVKKHKKQSGFIILGVFAFLVIAGFVVYKMFPDKVINLFKHDIVVEYLTGNEGSDEELNGENIDENSGGTEVDEFDLGQQGENNEDQGNGKPGENIDPNSLAGLLEGNTDGDQGGTDVNESNVDNNQGNEETNSESDGGGENIQNGSEEGEFDPFSEMNALLEVNEENKTKLNDYISKGQYYIDWGTENSNSVAKRYGEAILSSAQDQLTKLENGEEIDTTLFDRLDNYLRALSDLEGNN